MRPGYTHTFLIIEKDRAKWLIMCEGDQTDMPRNLAGRPGMI